MWKTIWAPAILALFRHPCILNCASIAGTASRRIGHSRKWRITNEEWRMKSRAAAQIIVEGGKSYEPFTQKFPRGDKRGHRHRRVCLGSASCQKSFLGKNRR